MEPLDAAVSSAKSPSTTHLTLDKQFIRLGTSAQFTSSQNNQYTYTGGGGKLRVAITEHPATFVQSQCG